MWHKHLYSIDSILTRDTIKECIMRWICGFLFKFWVSCRVAHCLFTLSISIGWCLLNTRTAMTVIMTKISTHTHTYERTTEKTIWIIRICFWPRFDSLLICFLGSTFRCVCVCFRYFVFHHHAITAFVIHKFVAVGINWVKTLFGLVG